MVNESALRPHRIDHIQEVDGAIPSDADFLPFADVVNTTDWSPDIPIEARQGIGTIDVQKHDRGTETHTFTIGFDLQGAIAEATSSLVRAEPVYEAIIRTASNRLERRTIVQRENHPGDGVEGGDRLIYSVARHAVPATLTLAGDPANNSPIVVELEYMTPRSRTYILDQPGRADILNIESSVLESFDVTIRGLNEAGSEARETVTLSSGYAETTTVFSRIYEIEAQGDHQGDLTVTRDKLGIIDPFEWSSSGSGTNEYYLEAEGGGDPGLTQPDDLLENGAVMSTGTIGTLATGEWNWGDNDSLGFNTVYVRLTDEADPDTKSENFLEADNNQDTVLFTAYGSDQYWQVEGDYGIPLVPVSGSRRTDHGGDEQRFLGDTIDRAGTPIAQKINSAELEIANNVETQSGHNSLGQEIESGVRDITLSATVFGEKISHVNIDAALRKVIADITWDMKQNVLTMPNAPVSDPGSRAREGEETFANSDVEFEPKDLTITVK